MASSARGMFPRRLSVDPSSWLTLLCSGVRHSRQTLRRRKSRILASCLGLDKQVLSLIDVSRRAVLDRSTFNSDSQATPLQA